MTIRSLPSLGAWIETYSKGTVSILRWSRSLHWERGLKPGLLDGVRSYALKSLPSLGAWIETRPDPATAWAMMSLPSLGAWIETAISADSSRMERVAPFIGSVD